MPQPGAKLIGEHFASQASQLCQFGSPGSWWDALGGMTRGGFALVGGRHRSLKPPPQACPALANLLHSFQGQGERGGVSPIPLQRGPAPPTTHTPLSAKVPGGDGSPL